LAKGFGASLLKSILHALIHRWSDFLVSQYRTEGGDKLPHLPRSAKLVGDGAEAGGAKVADTIEGVAASVT